MATISTTVVAVAIGPLDRAAGAVEIHDVQPDDDVTLDVGDRVEIRDGGGQHLAARVAAHHGHRYELVLEP